MKKVSKTVELNAKKNEIIKFYLAEVVSAVSYLHSKEIVHRDLKLENLVIGSDLHLRLIDFGTAKALIPNTIFNQKQI